MTLARLARTFLAGLAAVLPIVITAAVLLWLVQSVEVLLGGLVKVLIPDEAYRRGMGLVAAVVFIFAVGFLMEVFLFRRLLRMVEDQFARIPLVKTVYSAVRDLMGFFSKTGARRFSKVVLVDVPGLEARVVGFVTLDDHRDLPFAAPDDTVAVYLPMSYQIGGYTVFLPRRRLTPVDMTMEEAMRFVVTAGMSKS